VRRQPGPSGVPDRHLGDAVPDDSGGRHAPVCCGGEDGARSGKRRSQDHERGAHWPRRRWHGGLLTSEWSQPEFVAANGCRRKPARRHVGGYRAANPSSTPPENEWPMIVTRSRLARSSVATNWSTVSARLHPPDSRYRSVTITRHWPARRAVAPYTCGERPKPGRNTSGRPRPMSIGVASALGFLHRSRSAHRFRDPTTTSAVASVPWSRSLQTVTCDANRPGAGRRAALLGRASAAAG
jgi:hypothetical protein